MNSQPLQEVTLNAKDIKKGAIYNNCRVYLSVHKDVDTDAVFNKCIIDIKNECKGVLSGARFSRCSLTAYTDQLPVKNCSFDTRSTVKVIRHLIDDLKALNTFDSESLDRIL